MKTLGYLCILSRILCLLLYYCLLGYLFSYVGLQEIWTLCRIFKRNNVSSRIVRNPTNVRPKIINADSENREACISFGAPEVAHNEKKPDHAHKVEEKNLLLHGDSEAVLSCSSALGGEAREFFANGNWDEIVSAMENAFDPNHL